MKRPYRVVVAKPGLDGHDRGAKVIARALRDAGFEVIYTGLHQTPEQVVEAVVQEDADAVGLSLLSGAHMTLSPGSSSGSRDQGADDVLVFGGRHHPRRRHPRAKELGVAEIFTPGAPLATIASWLAEALDRREEAAAEQGRDRAQARRSPARPGRHPPHGRHRRPSPRRPTTPRRRPDDRDATSTSRSSRWTSSSTRASSTSPASASPSSPGGVADTVDEAVAQADAAGYPVVVKAQVQVGGRGKAGGIKLADDADEVRPTPAPSSGMDIKGHVVRRLWIEHASDIAKEYYASFTLDRGAKMHLGMVSAKGGVDIEQVAAEDPEAIARLHIDPVDGPRPRARLAAGGRGRPRSRGPRPGRRAPLNLYRCYVEGDCDLAEINPLILTTDGRVHALDAKVTLDDNAAFRHPEWDDFAGDRGARRAGAAGQGEGAPVHRPRGLGRHHRQRRRPGHEHAATSSTRSAARRPTSSTSAAGPTPTSWPPPSRSSTPTRAVRAIFVNIFGGITRGDEVANGIVEALAGWTSVPRSSSASTAPTPRPAGRSWPSTSVGPARSSEPTMLGRRRAGP